MKVAFFSEGGYLGKVPKNHINMRTDVAWVHCLNADHYPLSYLNQVTSNSYDLGIAILPKNKKPFLNINVAADLQRICKITSIMQESNYYLWQDNDVEDQIWYLNNLMEVDFMFVHNDIDKEYYSGLINKDCEKLPSVMVTDFVHVPTVKEDKVIIGGNLVSIYRGIDSFFVARELELPIYALSSGRKPANEEAIGINHLTWTNWLEWMRQLSSFKYAVQFGTGGAGSFNLNCAYLGIPCIGLKSLETQNICFPGLSIGDVELKKAKELIRKLKNDIDFYNECATEGKRNYHKYFNHELFLQTVTNIYDKQFNKKYNK